MRDSAEEEREDEGEKEEVVVAGECVCQERERERDQASWDDVGRPAGYVCTSHTGLGGEWQQIDNKIQQHTTRLYRGIGVIDADADVDILFRLKNDLCWCFFLFTLSGCF